MKQYKTVTVSRRVKLLDVHFVHNNVADITCKYKKRIRNKPPKPKVPDDASVIVSEDGNFIYRIEGRYWTCMVV